MKKIVSILLIALLVLSLAACGQTGNSASNSDLNASGKTDTDAKTDTGDKSGSDAKADGDTDTADEPSGPDAEEPSETGTALTTMIDGKLTIATSPDFPPFEYTDDNGAVIGIEPEIMELICEKLGLELQIDTMDFDGALMAAQQGKCDAIVSGVTITEDRTLIYDFTDSYTTITQAIVAPEGSGITMDNLGDYTIGVQRGTTGHIYAEDDFGDQVQAYDTYSLVFQALANGQVDCIVMDDAVANAYLTSYPGLTVVPTTYEVEEYAFGFHKGNEALVAAVNGALKELTEDGTIQNILDKYMSE